MIRLCKLCSVSCTAGVSEPVTKCVRRAQNDAVRGGVVSDIMDGIDKLCERRRLDCQVDRVHDAGAVQCSPDLVQGLLAAVKDSQAVNSPKTILDCPSRSSSTGKASV